MQVVAHERPDLQAQAAELVRQLGEYTITLKELEDNLLARLANSQVSIPLESGKPQHKQSFNGCSASAQWVALYEKTAGISSCPTPGGYCRMQCSRPVRQKIVVIGCIQLRGHLATW